MEIRQTSEQDRQVFIDTAHAAFGRFPEAPADSDGVWWSALDMDRGLLAMTDGRPIGTATAHSFELTLPGKGVVPAAGVTFVSVLPHTGARACSPR